MVNVLPSLIDKQDNFEIIGDQIAAILVAEQANQQALATVAAKDPTLWALNVYRERSDAWEQYLNDSPDETPIINIWWDNTNFDESQSNISERQKSVTTYNIDMYAYGKNQADGVGGHKAADKTAALNLQRVVRLVRNILMASENTYLQAQGLVWQRWPQSITSFQSTQGEQPVQRVQAARMPFRVGFNEFSPQYEPTTLDLLTVNVLRAEDGSIYLEADYDYT